MVYSPRAHIARITGTLWWSQALLGGLRDASPQRWGVRTVLRPRTPFDHVSLLDIQRVLKAEVAAGRVYTDLDEVAQLLLQVSPQLRNPLLAERLFRMFDVNGDGNLGASEIASGLLLIGYGGAEERLELTFELFDGLGGGDGLMAEREFATFLRALRAVSLSVVSSIVELVGEVFGPPPTGACPYNRPCAQEYVGKSQSCMVISGRLIVHAADL